MIRTGTSSKFIRLTNSGSREARHDYQTHDGAKNSVSVVDHDANRQHHCQQANRVGRIADGIQHDEAADQANRHRDCRDDGSAETAEKQVDHQHHQDKRLDQRLLHLMDRGGDEGGRVIGNFPSHVRREILFGGRDLPLHRLQRGDGVGAGRF
jgi:hypothetical protein